MKATQLFIIILFGLSLEVLAQDRNTTAQNVKVIHTVLFKFIPNTSNEQIDRLTSGIVTLKNTIPGIELVRYGENFSERSMGFTHAVIMTFSDIEALETFYAHPEHKKLIKDLILPIKEAILVIDYEDQATK